jgi:hypothetical protein
MATSKRVKPGAPKRKAARPHKPANRFLPGFQPTQFWTIQQQKREHPPRVNIFQI